MFVYNVKINGSKAFKYFFTGVVILIICILCIVLFRIFNGAQKSNNSGCLPQMMFSKYLQKTILMF